MTEPVDSQKPTELNGPSDQPRDLNQTASLAPSSDGGLDAALDLVYGRKPPQSSLGGMTPVLLQEARGESDVIVIPKSDAMPAPEQVGERYQLSGEIARGGMGAVLRGRDIDLGRDLAVKVLLEKYANRPEVARRFIEEAQIGGQLQHPGVVPVYDIGRFGDRPFFTMKLVKGKTLATLLGEREKATEDHPRLLGIALGVCQAVAYAHAKGVIHRDLKPANIMVGAFGEVQVMDWGLAKVLKEGGVADEERASRSHQEPDDGTKIRTARSAGSTGSFGSDTEAGSLLGTPAYMSPEQANGEIANLDRPADVFGLGAILCEILTGKPPYVGRSSEEVRRKAANGDLTDANSRLEACGADAELIRLTGACLAPEAIDRPRDAQAVVESLSTYLNGVQDRLRQAELAEAEAKAQAREEAKRRRLTVALACSILLAMALGLGGWLWVKADRDARLAKTIRNVNEAITQATALLEQAKASPTGSEALFGHAQEKVQRALALVENGPADAVLMAQVRQLKSELDEEEKDRKLIRDIDEARLAQIKAGTERTGFGMARERALPLFRDAFQDYGLQAGKEKPAAVAAFILKRPAMVRETLLATLEEWIELATYNKVAEPHLDWLQAVAVAVEPKDGLMLQFRVAREEKDKIKQRAALVKLAEEADVARLPAHSLIRLASYLLSVGAVDSAVRLLRAAQMQYPDNFWITYNLGDLLFQLGNLPINMKPPELEEAVRFLTAAVAIRPECLQAYNMLGIVLLNKGRVEEAIACFQKALLINPMSAGIHCNIGTALLAKNRVDEAIACFRKSIKLDPTGTPSLSNLGNTLMGKGEVDAAIDCYREVIKLDPKNTGVLLNLGNTLVGKGEMDGAIDCYREVIKLDPENPYAHFYLGNSLQDKGEVKEAIACFRKAIEIDPILINAHGRLGQSLLGEGSYAEARSASIRALALIPANHPLRAVVSQQLQECERLLKLEARLPAILRGEDQPASAQESLELAQMCSQIGMGLLEQKKWTEAEPLLRECLNIWMKLQPDSWTTFKTKSMLGGALLGQKKYTEAEPLLLAGFKGLKQRQDQISRPMRLTHLTKALERLVQLYDATNNMEESAKRRMELESKDYSNDELAMRQAKSAMALLRMNQSAKFWPLLKHNTDPTYRSYLIQQLSPLGADARALIQHLDEEPDLTICRALVLGLGGFGEKNLPLDERKALLPKLQEMYRTAADPGLHSSSEWLLRSWKQEAWLKQVNEEWAQNQELRQNRLAGIGQALAVEKEKTPQWYVNGQGQTLIVMPKPGEFSLGQGEERYQRRIERSYALASKEVTVEQFLRFRKEHPFSKEAAPSSNCPVHGVNWYAAVAYCNWLSEQEGIPREQWCYEPNPDGKYAEGMKLAPNYLKRTGYRLPTEAEWEYGCRAGADTVYSFGASADMLGKYAWFAENSGDTSHPVGLLMPNDLGLFDMHGNSWELCQDTFKTYGKGEDGKTTEDLEEPGMIRDSTFRVLRGGCFNNPEVNDFDPPAYQVRSGRLKYLPTNCGTGDGFRVARTIAP